ncbi:MAG: DUF1127 domain-containing protein [Hyphomicrobiaceae bacterium]
MYASVPTIVPKATSVRLSRSGLGRGLLKTIERIELAFQVAHERRALRTLDDRALKDLGLTHSDVHRETERSVWDVPERRSR